MWRTTSLSAVSCSLLYAAAPLVNLKESSAPNHDIKEHPIKRNLKTDYLIVGGGTTAFTAAKYLKDESDKRNIGSILVVSQEKHAPYMRPPLSKQLWTSADDSDFTFTNFSGTKQSIFYRKPDFFNENFDFKLEYGSKVTKLDTDAKEATLDSGDIVQYDKCLLATGGVPRELPVFSNHPSPIVQRNCSVFRTIDDYTNLKEKLKSCSKVAVIGGGYLGCELSIALAVGNGNKKLEVTQIIPESGYLGLVLPQFLSSWIGSKVQKMGVNFRENSRVKSVQPADDSAEQIELELSDGEKLIVDHVVVAVGIEPNVDLAESGNLEIDPKLGGYFVNSELQSSSPDVWVGGDACSFYDTKMKCRRRVEHHDHAVVSGRLAAKNMLLSKNGEEGEVSRCEQPESFYHQSMFWGDLGEDCGYEAMGVVDPKLHVKAYFKSKKGQPKLVESTDFDRLIMKDNIDMGEGVLFYLQPDNNKFGEDESKVVGVLCWNVFGKMNYARSILGQTFKNEDTEKLVKNFL